MRLLWLADELRNAGLTVVEHTGWQTHYRSGTWEPRYGVVHATAAPASQSDDTQVRIVRDGRTDLPGPIANACVDRQGRWHVLSAGRCNTTLTGTAGPFEGLGNSYALGVEACNDNRGEPWPSVQWEAYARGWAAICRKLGWTAANLVGHKEHTPGHKTDPTFNMGQFRARVGVLLAGGLEDDMSADDATIGFVRALNYARNPDNPEWTPAQAQYGRQIRGALQAIVAGALTGRDFTDEPAIVAGVLAGLDPEKIAAAIPPTLAREVADELARRIAS